MQSQDIERFLNQHNYDVRVTGDARWIDQKCTHDVVNIIADCILEYTQDDIDRQFTVTDIWQSDYAKKYVIDIFAKPNVDNQAAENEYDKFFSQPIKLLAYSGVLGAEKNGSRYIYKINNLDLLNYIALREQNSLNFLYLYIVKVLKDSSLYSAFDSFFHEQDSSSFRTVKDIFIKFTIGYTKINGAVECGRIFTKVLNPLAYKLKKKGTIRGKLSKGIITLSDLPYNRINWRDELSGKDKTQTRAAHELAIDEIKQEKLAIYTINKAKKVVRKYNDKYNSGLSEIKQENELINVTQAHHIFPQNEFPTIANFVENLIMITPNQHFGMAHPDNNTLYIDKDFQYICLVSKTLSIKESVVVRQDGFYRFDSYQTVLNTGLNTKEFNLIEDSDFKSILDKIDEFYSPLSENKYAYILAR